MLDKYINKIIKGDVIQKLKELPNESVDYIFADPPYFMQTEGELLRVEGTKFNGVEDYWDKFSNYKEYDEFSKNWLTECRRVLKKNGSICVIGSFQNIYRLGYIMQNLDFWIINDLIWNKSNPVPNFAGTRFCNSHETLLWCTKDKKSKFTFNYKTMKFLNNNKQEKSVWNLSLCTGNERIKDENGKKLHSTQKPESLLEKLILSSTKPNDIVLDPFFGTGTTGVVAKKYGRRYIGIEREEKYVKAAEIRLSKTKDESNDVSNLKLEIKPPKVSMKKLIEKSYILAGEMLYSKDRKQSALILENGNLRLEDIELSIHKMSARFLNKVNNNGWDYFYYDYKGNFISINELRYLYEKNENLKG